MNILVSLWAWFGYIDGFSDFTPGRFFLTRLVTIPFDEDRKLPNAIFMTAGRAFLWFNPCGVSNCTVLNSINQTDQ